MLLRIPNFYDKFTCIANRCTDNCCIGWEIDVDEDTLDYYKSIACKEKCGSAKKDYIQKFLENIEDGHIKLTKDERCPFLKENGLCDTICHLGVGGTDCDENGRNVLGNICREHPRFVEVYGDIMEKGVGLCCEEAVRLLLTSTAQDNSILTFIESEVNDEPDEMPDGVEEARDAIFQERETIFGILNNSSIPLNQRLIEILDFALAMSDCDNSENSNDNENLSEQAIHQTWIEILGEGESYGPAWDKAYERMIHKGWQQPQPLFTDEDGARIVAYLIFRYYAKSLFDGDCLTKVQFAIYFWIILKQFSETLGTINPDGRVIESATDPQTVKINAVKLLSKQTEYSEEIMEILADNFFENPAFSVEQFRNIILES